MTAASASLSPGLQVAARRSAPEVVDVAINLARRHYPTLVTVSAVPLMPMLLLVPFSASIPQVVVNILSTICAGWAESCLLIGIAAVYRGEPLPTAAAQLRAGRGVAWRVIRITFARNVATYIGLLLLIVPGLFAYAYYLLGAPVAALENLEVRPAIKRGAALAKGEYRRIILIAGLSGLLYLLILLAVGVVVGMVGGGEGITLLAFTATQIFMLPVLVAITVLLYYDIRERREGLDIEMALRDIADPALSSPPPR
jgi:hypothetical protein